MPAAPAASRPGDAGAAAAIWGIIRPHCATRRSWSWLKDMRSSWLATLLLVGGTVANADEYSPPPPPPIASPITDHLALRASFFWGRVQTTGHIDGADLPGTPFSAEHDLGLTDKAFGPLVELIFRLENRSRLRVDFLDMRRLGDNTIDRTIQFGDQSFQANTAVKSELDWRQMDFTYTYSFLRGDSYELGAGVGIHLLEAEFTAQVPDTSQRADFSGATPFATAALDGTWRFARHWSLNARGQYMHVTLSSVSGTLGIYHADLQYRWRYNLAFGAGYQRQQMAIDVLNSDPSGLVHMNIAGPEAFVRVSF
jgi:hypothetical protein